MPRRRRSPVAFTLAILVAGMLAGPVGAEPIPPLAPTGTPDAPEAALTNGQVRLATVTSGLSSPIGVVNAGDGTDRLFVVEQRGTVRVVQGSSLQNGLFLDLRGISGGLATGGERGLLGLAFHPSFESNRKLFVYYTRGGGGGNFGDIVIAELTANAARTSVSASSLDPIMTIEHSSQSNHNGGQLLFGPDGYLYVFTGDGGGGGDPDENGQDLNSRLGKTLRIDPDLNGGFDIPSGNPFVGETGLDEIWSLGLRNPWRASFDRETEQLWIADVGQGSWEEINREPPITGGRNYGWDCREGFEAYEGGCTGLTLTNPVAAYGHGSGDCSVTGGYVYRGDVFLDFVGQYVLGDFCTGKIWTLSAGAGSPSLQFHRDTTIQITSFGESEKGELYLTSYGGTLYRVVAPPFSDVTNASLIDHIMWIYYAGISTGCGGGRYCPDESVTRAEMAAFLSRALDLPATNEDFFTDDDSHPLEASINRVAAAGIAFGCTSTRYCPNNPVTRAQMASFIDRAFDLPSTTNDYFVDDEGLTHENAINRLARAGITGGCTDIRFCPDDATTRAQMAAFLHRAIGD
ncbi:MAG TPA: PQQ-dependent sugar dehydrogenase [Candidatus Limnocylindria bacterium]|jgi:glucose/arabinose dehydrogenase